MHQVFKEELLQNVNKIDSPFFQFLIMPFIKIKFHQNLSNSLGGVDITGCVDGQGDS